MSRTKTVFKPHEIAHAWAHRLAPYGRANSASFEGDRFYSYATCIAVLVQGKAAVVIDSEVHSSFTAKHKRRVYRAIPDSLEKFWVHGEGRRYGVRHYDNPKVGSLIVAHWLNEFKRDSSDATHRQARIRAKEVARKLAALDEAIRAAKFFGLATGKLEKLKAKWSVAGQSADTLISEALAKKKAAKEKADRRLHASLVAKEIANAEEIIANPKLIERANLNFDRRLLAGRRVLLAQVEQIIEDFTDRKISDWESGVGSVLAWEFPTRLRIEGDEVVTSKGARVPLVDAERAYRFARINRVRGWRENGESKSVGGYAINSVSSDGVVVGCHRFSWDALQSLARRAGWKDISESLGDTIARLYG